MPAMASITVKKSDGTTDIIYDAMAASGGDNSPAFWRQDTGNTAALPVGLRNSLKVQTTWNGPKTARQMKVNFVSPFPVYDSTTATYSSNDRIPVEIFATIPQGLPPAHINEAIHQAFNLAASALVKSIGTSGYSAT